MGERAATARAGEEAAKRTQAAEHAQLEDARRAQLHAERELAEANRELLHARAATGSADGAESAASTQHSPSRLQLEAESERQAAQTLQQELQKTQTELMQARAQLETLRTGENINSGDESAEADAESAAEIDRLQDELSRASRSLISLRRELAEQEETTAQKLSQADETLQSTQDAANATIGALRGDVASLKAELEASVVAAQRKGWRDGHREARSAGAAERADLLSRLRDAEATLRRLRGEPEADETNVDEALEEASSARTALPASSHRSAPSHRGAAAARNGGFGEQADEWLSLSERGVGSGGVAVGSGHSAARALPDRDSDHAISSTTHGGATVSSARTSSGTGADAGANGSTRLAAGVDAAFISAAGDGATLSPGGEVKPDPRVQRELEIDLEDPGYMGTVSQQQMLIQRSAQQMDTLAARRAQRIMRSEDNLQATPAAPSPPPVQTSDVPDLGSGSALLPDEDDDGAAAMARYRALQEQVAREAAADPHFDVEQPDGSGASEHGISVPPTVPMDVSALPGDAVLADNDGSVSGESPGGRVAHKNARVKAPVRKRSSIKSKGGSKNRRASPYGTGAASGKENPGASHPGRKRNGRAPRMGSGNVANGQKGGSASTLPRIDLSGARSAYGQ